MQVCGSQDAQRLQDIAAERCSMPYRAPELFNVKSYCVIDQRTDIWVRIIYMAVWKKGINFIFVTFRVLLVYCMQCVILSHLLMPSTKEVIQWP